VASPLLAIPAAAGILDDLVQRLAPSTPHELETRLGAEAAQRIRQLHAACDLRAA
jgi:hypothetical protein